MRTPYNNRARCYEISATILIRPRSRLTLDATINPDITILHQPEIRKQEPSLEVRVRMQDGIQLRSGPEVLVLHFGQAVAVPLLEDTVARDVIALPAHVFAYGFQQCRVGDAGALQEVYQIVWREGAVRAAVSEVSISKLKGGGMDREGTYD